MEEEFENNDSINFQENIKNSQDNFIKESMQKNYEEDRAFGLYSPGRGIYK